MILGALVDAGVPLDESARRARQPGRSSATRSGPNASRAPVSARRSSASAARTSGATIVTTMATGEAMTRTPARSRAPADGRSRAPARLRRGAFRTLSEICRLIDGSSLTPAGKDRAKALFARLGDAEAAIHGTPLDKVHLHEVGALDSIIDIVGDRVRARDAEAPIASWRHRSTSAAAACDPHTVSTRCRRRRPCGCCGTRPCMPGRSRRSS